MQADGQFHCTEHVVGHPSLSSHTLYKSTGLWEMWIGGLTHNSHCLQKSVKAVHVYCGLLSECNVSRIPCSATVSLSSEIILAACSAQMEGITLG